MTGRLSRVGIPVPGAAWSISLNVREYLTDQVLMTESGILPSERVYFDHFEGTAYREIRHIGSGGMGDVYLVEHAQTGRALVAKLLHEVHEFDPRLIERMRIEAQVLGKLNHEHVVKVVGAGMAPRWNRPFLVMEHLEGQSLAGELKKLKKLPVYEAFTLACQLLSALEATHAKEIVHRDIKPENLFICRRPDGSPCLKVLDFGLARVMPGNKFVAPLPHELRTETGAVLGTPRYLSPEGAMGIPVDTRADVYASGLVLYMMLVGRGPFDHLKDEYSKLIQAHVVIDADPPSRFSDEPVPPEVDRVVLRALAKSLDERYQSAREFREALIGVMDLLRRPSGWLETTAFDGAQHASFPSSAGDSADARASAPAEPAVELSEVQRRVVHSRLTIVMVFLVGMLIAGLAAVGMVAVIMGVP